MTEELSKLQQTFSDVADFARTYPTALRTVKPDEIAFSATEILYHLIDVEYLWQRRIKQLITTTERQFTRIDPDGLAKEKHYNEKNFEKGIEEWFEAREETIDLIEEMSESERLIAGSHPKFGEIDTHAIVRIMLDHDKQHLDQFKRTLGQVEKK